jgi:hypothetical protein
LVDLRKIQYARDDERPHFCINLNNIDNEVYCDFIVMLTSFQTISSINYAFRYHVLFTCSNEFKCKHKRHSISIPSLNRRRPSGEEQLGTDMLLLLEVSSMAIVIQ